jgi:ABC-type multidrug transport system permease subunit
MAQWGGRTQIQQVAIVLVFLILAFIILFLRLYTRVIVTRNYGPEDWFIVAAFVGLFSSLSMWIG